MVNGKERKLSKVLRKTAGGWHVDRRKINKNRKEEEEKVK